MINEDKIREACASDKEHGFKLLMENFQQPIYWHIRRLVVSHEDAEDILQEVFIRVFRHLDRFRDCLLYTSPSPRDMRRSRMPSSA